MTGSERPICLLLAISHPILRVGIRTVLEETPDVEIIGEAWNGTEAQDLTIQRSPQVLLLDPHISTLRLIETMDRVRIHCPETATLVWGMGDEDTCLSAVIEAGAVGFLTGDVSPETLVEAIRRVARGEVLFSGEELVQARCWREEVGKRWESLTRRERHVLQLLTEGQNNAAIAEVLGVTTKTVEYHVSRILRKLGATSRLEGAVWALKHPPDDLRGGLQDDLGKSLMRD
jgi:two-component system response regulator NreC